LGGLTVSHLIASTVISSAGFVLFFAGKKRGEWKLMTAGGLLFVLTFLVQKETVLLCLGAAVIVGALYVFRD
jgi:hypothetical protein